MNRTFFLLQTFRREMFNSTKKNPEPKKLLYRLQTKKKLFFQKFYLQIAFINDSSMCEPDSMYQRVDGIESLTNRKKINCKMNLKS